jgi:predicted DNA-binding protein with PD1-like motif
MRDVMYREIRSGRYFMGRLELGDDLYDALTSFCENNNIKLGRVEAIGAVEKACIEFYDQGKRDGTYNSIPSFAQPLEILNLTGNISLKDGKPMVHAHITLADSRGNAYGGHLVPGTKVFACEFIIQTFEGEDFKRANDRKTGLKLWQL